MLYHYTSPFNWGSISRENKLKPFIPKYEGNPKGVYLTDLPPSTDDLKLFETFYGKKPVDGIYTSKFEICICLDENMFECTKLRKNVFYCQNEIDLKEGHYNIVDRRF